MQYRQFPALLFIVALVVTGTGALAQATHDINEKILSYVVDPQKQDLQLYWKDDSGQVLGSIDRLRSFVDKKGRTLVFAMNGGMYTEEQGPLGLFIQQQKVIKRLNTASASGNFYLKPNGVFYITTDKKGDVCRTEDFKQNKNISYATQSGPMLLIDGAFHPAFTKGSSNVNIRNGVGVLPGNKLLFAITRLPMNLYDFADFFRQQGCQNALYFDGFVSRAYLPEKQWMQTGGNFGVMIGVTDKKKVP